MYGLTDPLVRHGYAESKQHDGTGAATRGGCCHAEACREACTLTRRIRVRVARDSDAWRRAMFAGKLVFIAERALPMPASMAKLRTRFPNWSFDTVVSRRATAEPRQLQPSPLAPARPVALPRFSPRAAS